LAIARIALRFWRTIVQSIQISFSCPKEGLAAWAGTFGRRLNLKENERKMSGDLLLVRAVLVSLVVLVTYLLLPADASISSAIVAFLCALAFAAAVIACEIRLRALSLKSVIWGTLGLTFGLLAATLIGYLVSLQGAVPPETRSYATLALTVMMGYVGLVIGGAKGDLRDFGGVLMGQSAAARPAHLVLDTSVIIDGRVADIAETGFLAGRLVIPQFVLRELQQVADSADSMKRNRGRRGLDILQRIQKNQSLDIMITDVDFVEVREVDLKLIELAKHFDAKIVTNDFNLNKVAQLRGVTVLNINELANALRPVVLPGETMRVFILKEGKEYSQGVAYLDDGTMVVVDNARRCIGRTIDINVTSVLQTTAGKMIFGRFLEEVGGQRNDGKEPNGRESRNGGGERERSERPERFNTPPRPIAPVERAETRPNTPPRPITPPRADS
jgi:uncharacterized protein YacL